MVRRVWNLITSSFFKVRPTPTRLSQAELVQPWDQLIDWLNISKYVLSPFFFPFPSERNHAILESPTDMQSFNLLCPPNWGSKMESKPVVEQSTPNEYISDYAGNSEKWLFCSGIYQFYALLWQARLKIKRLFAPWCHSPEVFWKSSQKQNLTHKSNIKPDLIWSESYYARRTWTNPGSGQKFIELLDEENTTIMLQLF